MTLTVLGLILDGEDSRREPEMAIDPEELLPRKKRAEIVLGEDISAMSAHELELRIAALEAEIARSREAIAARNATKSAAAAVFKR
jgi:uncharacterized small protein (DUF1192 family)